MRLADVGQGEPLLPGEVAADVSRLVEGPAGRDPARDERVQRGEEPGAGLAVDRPPRDLRVGALFLRRIDVDAAEQCGFRVIEECVVERLVGGDLGLVAGEVVQVLLVSEGGRRPAPRCAAARTGRSKSPGSQPMSAQPTDGSVRSPGHFAQFSRTWHRRRIGDFRRSGLGPPGPARAPQACQGLAGEECGGDQHRQKADANEADSDQGAGGAV